MGKDKGRHRQMRDKLLEIIEDRPNKEQIRTSHDEKGDIKLKWSDKGPIMSEPDLIVTKDGCVLIIEIELSSAPKHILGVIHANAFGKLAILRKMSPIRMASPSVLVVLDNSRGQITKPGSEKALQLVAILGDKTASERLDYDIVYDEEESETGIKEADQRIRDWLAHGHLR